MCGALALLWSATLTELRVVLYHDVCLVDGVGFRGIPLQEMDQYI